MSSRCASASKRASTTVHGGGRPSACCISVVSFKPAPSAFPLLAHPDPAWRRARRRQGRCAPRKRGRLRPSLTAAARDALGWSGRDEETALSSRTKKHPRWGEPSRTARVRRSPQPTPNGEEAKKLFPLETLKEAAALGMGGVTVRDEFGGSGLGRLDSTLIFEALATGCPRVAQSRRLPHRQSLLSPDRAASNWRTRPGIEHAGCK